MNKRHTGKMGVHNLVHFGVGPNLEKMRKLKLDFRERAARGDLQYKGGISEQGPIADCRNESIGCPLDDFESNGAAAELGAEKLLQISHHRGEHVFEVVLIVGRILARTSLGCREGSKLTDQSKEFLKQTFGMQITGGTKVLQNRN